MESTTTLKQQWELLKIEDPKLRIRDAAQKMRVSEAELVNTGSGHNVTILKNDFQELLKETNTLGYVMALTRNDHCVHERKGVYTKVGFNGPVGLVVTADIDLRLFMTHWHFGFAVNESDRLSLQFFDADGSAVHKIYLTDKSDVQAFHNLVDKYKADEQQQLLTIKPVAAPAIEKPDSEVNVAAFRQSWLDLKDTHEFHGMLKQYQLSRTQALRLAPEGHANQITLAELKQVLTNASESSLPIMVFTGSAGCIQIHTGEVKRLVQTGPWFNVLDPEFNMHLREDGIATIWLVKKPTTDGHVHSIEVFDSNGGIIVQFFGKRKPGLPESEGWREVLKS